jgi:hypothetical protein
VARLTRFRTARMTVLVASSVVLAGLFIGVVRQSWVTNSAAQEIVRDESYGAEMMHPMTTLLGNLVEAQSDAVRGEPIDGKALRDALASVAKVDRTRGDTLVTHQRLSDLTAQVERALNADPKGRDGYAEYTDLVTLTLDLIQQIGDNSHLAHDPDLDSFYVMEAAIDRLPNAVVLAGRASDLVALAGGKTLEGEDAVRGAVARFGVSEAAEAVNTGLTKSVDETDRAELGSNIAQRLDTFKAAADAFAPPTVLANLAGAVDAATMAANARRVYAAATPLSHLLIGELQALLKSRTDKLAGQWRFIVIASIAVAVFVILVVWLLIVGRRSVAQLAGVRGDDLPVGSLTSARELLEAQEYHRPGRTSASRPRGDGDAR